MAKENPEPERASALDRGEFGMLRENLAEAASEVFEELLALEAVTIGTAEDDGFLEVPIERMFVKHGTLHISIDEEQLHDLLTDEDDYANDQDGLAERLGDVLARARQPAFSDQHWNFIGDLGTMAYLTAVSRPVEVGEHQDARWRALYERNKPYVHDLLERLIAATAFDVVDGRNRPLAITEVVIGDFARITLKTRNAPRSK
jgi:hypothetical protein